MYIRRKVFSVAYDEMTGEEKLFSTTEIMDEEAYLEEREYALLNDGSGVSISQIKEKFEAAGGKKGTGLSFNEYYKNTLGDINNSIKKADDARHIHRKVTSKKYNEQLEAIAKKGKGTVKKSLVDKIKNKYQNAGKLGKAGMILVPAAAVGGAIGAGVYASKKKKAAAAAAGEKEFSETKKRRHLDKIESHRGLGRSLLLGGVAGAAGGYAGKRAAEEADDKGASDREILRVAGKRGAAVGGAAGALRGAGLGALYGGGRGAVYGATAGALGSALGGYAGARKNTKVRLRKRKELEEDDD